MTVIHYLTVHEAAQRMQVSDMTIYRAVTSKQLRARRVGRLYRIHPQHFAEWVRSLDTIDGAIGAAS